MAGARSDHRDRYIRRVYRRYWIETNRLDLVIDEYGVFDQRDIDDDQSVISMRADIGTFVADMDGMMQVLFTQALETPRGLPCREIWVQADSRSIISLSISDALDELALSECNTVEKAASDGVVPRALHARPGIYQRSQPLPRGRSHIRAGWKTDPRTRFPRK